MELKDIISMIPMDRVKLKQELKTKDNNMLKKYTNTASKELLNLVKTKKITNDDFRIILYNKLTEYLGKDEKDILNSNGDLLNNYKNFFKNDSYLVNVYHNKYKKMKKTIQKIKDENAKKTSIKNKIKKQSSHLLGDSKLKSLSKKDALHLEEMAKENRLTIPDFFNILKYKLTNEYLGTITEQICKKHQDIFCDALQFFYSGFNFSKEKRQSEIKKISDFYMNIVSQINNEKEINLIVDNKNNIAKKIKLKSYQDFKNDSKSFFDKYNQFVDEVERRQVVRNRWLKNVKGTVAYQDITLKLNEDAILATLIPARRKLLKEIENKLINNNQSKYLFNAFKLIKEEWYSKQLPPDFSYIIALYQYDYSYGYYNENMDKNYYILESTKDNINTIISEYLNAKVNHAGSFANALHYIKGFDPKKLKKIETNAPKNSIKQSRPPVPSKPLPPLPLNKKNKP